MKELVVVTGVSIVGINLVVFCFVNGFAIIAEIQSIGEEFNHEMSEFRTISNEIASELLEMAKPLREKVSNFRNRRQSYYEQFTSSYYPPAFPSYALEQPRPPSIMPPVVPEQDSASVCRCSPPVVNTCPKGSPGQKGVPGLKGLPGLDGLPGLPGDNCENVETIIQNYGICMICPTGKPGPTGPRGQMGVRGVRGQRGLNGIPGRDGSPGSNNEYGLSGPDGPIGPVGRKGRSGQNAKVIRSVEGPKGATGSIGLAGIPGERGTDGTNGKLGLPGLRGSPGINGRIGKDGTPGPTGLTGAIGADAMYCPCPLRSQDLEVE